jgi:DNA-binding protein HU-beta
MASKPMSKSQVVAALADKNGMTKKAVATFFDNLQALAAKECKGGAGKFIIPGLGRAVKRHRAARMGRNPQTGEAIKIKAKTVVKLFAAKAFKDAVLGH